MPSGNSQPDLLVVDTNTLARENQRLGKKLSGRNPSKGSMAFRKLIQEFDQGQHRTGVDLVQVIKLLGKTGPQSLECLAAQARVGVNPLAYMVGTMTTMGFVTTLSKPGYKEVRLTPLGKVLSQRLPLD